MLKIIQGNFKLFDAHCHLPYSLFISSFNSINEVNLSNQPKELLSRNLAFSSTFISDFPSCDLYNSFHDESRCTIGGVGIHPWFAHLQQLNEPISILANLTPEPTKYNIKTIFDSIVSNNTKDDDDNGDNAMPWVKEMQSRFLLFPKVFIGEIGLDKSFIARETNKNEIIKQIILFIYQFNMAIRYQKPVVLHCVQAHGIMYDIIRLFIDHYNNLPPNIYFHSFGGPIDCAKSYYKLKTFGNRFYFGFSAVINNRSPKTKSVIASIPDDKLLLESDLECLDNYNEYMMDMVQLIAEAKNWEIEETIEKTHNNAKRFYSL